MKGIILDYTAERKSGLISSQDGNRYTFALEAWKEVQPPAKGMAVDFDPQGTEAFDIYVDATAVPKERTKSRIAAGLFAILLGGLGIHKFYLGYTGPGLVYLLTNTIGWAVTVFLGGIPNMILAVISFVEGVLYLTKTDDEFEETYVKNRKSWL